MVFIGVKFAPFINNLELSKIKFITDYDNRRIRRVGVHMLRKVMDNV